MIDLEYLLLGNAVVSPSQLSGLQYDLLISSFNVSERVQTVFEQVNAVRKVWLIHPEYEMSASALSRLTADAFVPNARILETQFWSDFYSWLGSSIPPGSRVLVDITGMLRPHIMLLPLFLRQWGLGEADFLYSDPDGYEGGAGAVFSKGVIDRVAQVPALEGAHDARIPDEVLIIGAGYDSRLVAELAKSRARAKHRILLGLPGLQPQMYQESQLRVAEVGESLSRLSDRSFVYCAASDPWVTAATLRDIVRDERGLRPVNLYLAPVGPKTQVLGFGWYFLTDERYQPTSMLFPYTTKYSPETSHGLARSHVFSLELDWIQA